MVEWFEWHSPKPSRRVQLINSVLKKLGFWTSLQPPRASGVMTNIEQRMNIFHFVSQVLAYRVPGDLVELGCNEGQSSVLIQKVMGAYDSSRRLHVYDSFDGLPGLSSKDGNTAYKQGQLKTTRDLLVHNFARYQLPVPEIHQGWFEETLPDGLPEQICFAYLDGDLYDSILISLQHVYPRLSRGAICVIEIMRILRFFPTHGTVFLESRRRATSFLQTSRKRCPSSTQVICLTGTFVNNKLFLPAAWNRTFSNRVINAPFSNDIESNGDDPHPTAFRQ